MKLSSTTINTRLLAFSLCGMLLGSCQETTPRDIATAAPDVSADSAMASAETTGEYLDWETASLNGKQPALGKTEALYKMLGQPDSVVKPNMNEFCGSFYDKPLQYAYFKQSVVEVYGDTAVIGSLNFRNNPQLELRTAAIRLNHNTTLDELTKRFPQAAKKQGSVDVEGLGKLTTISIPTGKTPNDDAWLLFFDGGKLVRIDYWMPC
ncbi:hypothetical protein [Hymenobacter gelipurpurascens]|nr:hypothetical protein [Hymenobacter gelipurpurascens]